MNQRNILPLWVRGTVVAVWLTLLSAAPSLAAVKARLTLLDGRQIEAEIDALAPSGQLQGAGIPAGLDLDGLRKIEALGEESPAPEPAVVVELQGGTLNASGVTLADDKLQVAWMLGDPLAVPVEVVRAVRFDPKTPGDVFDEALAKPSAEHDSVFVKIDDRLQSVSGLVESITPENIVFDFGGQKRTLARNRVYGIVVAQFGGAQKPSPRCRLLLRDGSRLSGEPVSLAGGVLELALEGESKVKLPLVAVSRIDIRSTRLAMLSDLEPAEVREQPLVTFGRPWQRDRSVAGGPLRLAFPKTDAGGERELRQFEKGIGAHARSQLTFDCTGYDAFAAVIGIDAETEGRGDCEFVVLADGRELYRQRVQGGDAPRDVQLDIKGARRLTLLVEPGQDLDLADHADWCDARLLRLTPK